MQKSRTTLHLYLLFTRKKTFAAAMSLLLLMGNAAMAQTVINVDGAEPSGVIASTNYIVNILPGADVQCVTFVDPFLYCEAISVSGQSATVNFIGGEVSGDLSYSGGTAGIHTFNFFGGVILGGPAGGADGSGMAVFNFHGTSLSSTNPTGTPTVGTTTVTGFLSDGNPINYTIDTSGQHTVNLFPLDPEAETEVLGLMVLDLELSNGLENSLLSKLENVLSKLSDNNPKNDQAACGILEAFIHQVNSQSGKTIHPSDADDLIAQAQTVIVLLCP